MKITEFINEFKIEKITEIKNQYSEYDLDCVLELLLRACFPKILLGSPVEVTTGNFIEFPIGNKFVFTYQNMMDLILYADKKHINLTFKRPANDAKSWNKIEWILEIKSC